jgi:ribosomal protein S8E
MVTNLGSSFVSNLTVFSGAIISTNTAPSTNFLGYAIFGANQTSATNRIISFIDPTNNNAFVGHIRRNGDGLDINANAVNFKMNTAGYTMAGTSVLMNGGSLQVSVGSITIAGTGAANGNLTVGRTATISSNLVCNGVFSLGTNGTLHTALYSATAVLDFTNSLVLGTSQTNKINITGVHPNDAVIMGPPVDLSSVTDSFFRAYIAESNVVTVLRTAFTATTVYTNKTWRATVLSP